MSDLLARALQALAHSALPAVRRTGVSRLLSALLRAWCGRPSSHVCNSVRESSRQVSDTRVGVRINVDPPFVGMALGGWWSGRHFRPTGSYWQAFANGVLWNLLKRLPLV